MFCYNRTEGGDFMPVGVLTNVCAVFIGTFIGGFIKKILPKHLIEELPKVFGICSVTIGITSILNVKTLPMVIMAIILGFVIGELCHLYDHVHDIFAFLLDKLPFHIEGNQEEYMHLYLLVVLMFSMSGMGLFGALTEGMSGDASVLISKSVLDFFYSCFIWSCFRLCTKFNMCSTITYFTCMFLSGKSNLTICKFNNDC